MGRVSLQDKRREEITMAFYEVAKEVGLENATIAKVADKMKISKGLVMHYFATKESLIFALNDEILNRYLNFVVSDKYLNISTQKELENYIRSLFSREWNHYIDDGVFYSFYAMIYQNEKIRANYRNFLLEIRNGIYTILTNSHQQGIIKNADITKTANILYALIDGAYFQLGSHINNEVSYLEESQLFIDHALSLLEFSELS
ncbi:TetR family transcriptional regulator [Ochrovirga pacifica]|uniref:TetR family transcriptional regulator n=1 Tax=Ochrovirga pacifica TaxID=1042376 RepID=UPI0002558EA6|nr:TetR family transcriptional regulator [Ochrovirga pacifica]